MRTKPFDCVAVKRRDSLSIDEEIKGLSIQEKIVYWREQSQRFRARREQS
jgi:hypothetical protein